MAQSEHAIGARYEKAALLYLAVRKALESGTESLPAAPEFLRLGDWTEEVPPDVFSRVWRDPFAYWWSRLAFSLTGARLSPEQPDELSRDYLRARGEPDPGAALNEHLHLFKRVVLGLALEAGRDIDFETPLELDAAVPIPGTPLVLPGPLGTYVAGVRGGRILAIDGLALETRSCPTVSIQGSEWLLQPFAWRMPGLSMEIPEAALDLAWQAQQAGLAREALELIFSLRPQLAPLFSAVTWLMPFKPLEAGDFTNVTHSELPGCFIVSVDRQPYDLADTIIHEVHHNLLYAFEEEGQFLDPDYGDSEAHYSPWRPDPRDLHGILHAVYVHAAVTRFWLEVHGRGGAPDLREHAADHLVRYPLQMRLGMEVLDRRARFTLEGAALMRWLREQIAELSELIARTGVAPDAPALISDFDGGFRAELDAGGRRLSARESVLEHVRRYDRDGGGREAMTALGLAPG